MRKFLNFSRFAVLAALLFLSLHTEAEPPKSSNYYGEKIEFDSIGVKGSTRSVWSYLSLPPDTGKPVPAMVIVHGSGGLSGREARYVAEYNRMGIATLVLAPFEVRGVKSTSEDQSLVPQSEMNSDAMGALRYLQANKRIDPQRIGIQGGSKGGNVALSLAFDDVFRTRKMANSERFALHIPIYPACSYLHRNPVTTGKPILMLHGELDDYTNPARCKAHAEHMKANGANVQFIGYPGAYHGFDGPDTLTVRWFPNVQNAWGCLAYEEDDGSVTDEQEGKHYKSVAQFLQINLQRPCMTRGAHVGVNKEAKQKSLEDIVAFFARNGFKN